MSVEYISRPVASQEEILQNLNPPQLEAVLHIDGPLLVLAGAGSGKTRVLTCRVAHLLQSGSAEPEQILAVTFTNKAAGEMKARIAQLTGIDSRRMQISTFHSFCSFLLRIYGKSVGIPSDFTIYDEDDSLSLIKQAMSDLGYDRKTLSPNLAQDRISDAKSEMIGVEQYFKLGLDLTGQKVAKIYELYQQKLRACKALDFDDLLFQAVHLLQIDEEIRQRLQGKYRYLLIDEYQDTNHVQYLLSRLLSESRRNICAVGDEDQSIYGWRGANINNILDFEKDFPGCKVVRLEQNYRSTKNILKAASAVVARNRLRKGKTLYSIGVEGQQLTLMIAENDRQEADQVTIRIEEQIRVGTPRKEIAILYRTNAQSRAIEESLRRRFISYRIVGGLRFYQRKEVKDLLAYLRLIVNPKDNVSFRRIINYPKRGIGDATVEKLGVSARQIGCSLLELIADHSLQGSVAELSSSITSKTVPVAKLISHLREQSAVMPLEPLMQLVAEESGMIRELKDEEDPLEAENRIENINELAASAGEFQLARPEASLTDFLQEISLYTDLDDYDRDADSVTLMTLHAAKGLEFESVFITGLEEGLLPHSRYLTEPDKLEEERRLFYVGMTRAKSKLTITYALSRARLGGTQSVRSRFVDEIPDEVVDPIRYALLNEGGQVNMNYTEDDHLAAIDDPFMRIKIGSSVYHPRWGEGRVLSRFGSGDSTELEVRFNYAGTKKLIAKYAKLRLLR